MQNQLFERAILGQVPLSFRQSTIMAFCLPGAQGLRSGLWRKGHGLSKIDTLNTKQLQADEKDGSAHGGAFTPSSRGVQSRMQSASKRALARHLAPPVSGW